MQKKTGGYEEERKEVKLVRQRVCAIAYLSDGATLNRRDVGRRREDIERGGDGSSSNVAGCEKKKEWRVWESKQ